MTFEEGIAMFDDIARHEWDAVPQHVKARMRNLMLLIENEPTAEQLSEQGMGADDTLLGLYAGVPLIERGAGYDESAPLPDSITLFRVPHVEMAEGDETILRDEIRATIWHELAHHFGFDETMVESREDTGTNDYR